MNDEEIKVSELDLASEIRDTDQIMIVQGGANKKVLGENINKHGVTISSITPDTTQTVWFKQSKNLLSSTLELGTYSDAGIKSGSSTNYRNSTLIQVQPNTTYTFSINGVSQKYAVYYYNSSMKFISVEGLETGTFTTPANCYYINFRCFNADFTSDYASLKLQIEQGDTATSYVDYVTPQILVDNREIYNINNKTNCVKIWEGTAYQQDDTMVLDEPLEINKLYLFKFLGNSGYIHNYEIILYTGQNDGFGQINYYSYPDTIGFRYRFNYSPNTKTITIREAINSATNRAIKEIYKVN